MDTALSAVLHIRIAKVLQLLGKNNKHAILQYKYPAMQPSGEYLYPKVSMYPCVAGSCGVTCTFSISVHQVQDSGVYSTVLAPGKLGDMQVTRGIHAQYTQAAGIRSSVYTVSLTVIVQYHYK